MKKGKVLKPKADTNFKKVVNSKITYLILLIFLLVYLYGDDRVLNIPLSFFIFKLVITLLVISLLLFWRYTKYKDYYRRKFKDKIYVISLIVIVSVFSIIIQGIFNIPLNYVIKYKAQNEPLEVYNCEITNVITINIDKIHFKFKGKSYSRYFEVNEYERTELMNNFYLQLQVQKTFWNIYYINGMDIRKR